MTKPQPAQLARRDPPPDGVPSRPPLPSRPAVHPIAAHAPRDGPDRQRFRFGVEPVLGAASALFGVTSERTCVEITPDELIVRFGWWTVRTPVSNVASVHVTGPYAWPKVIGPPRLSLADGGVTFATTTKRGACIMFNKPVRALLPVGPLRHPSLTVTVEDPTAFVDALRHATATA